jgi:hypothetical protein
MKDDNIDDTSNFCIGDDGEAENLFLIIHDNIGTCVAESVLVCSGIVYYVEKERSKALLWYSSCSESKSSH